ncbi:MULTISPECIES: CPBP family intramembrane glutamic endopeptidase [Bacillus]|uniref:CPBP family intramembrane metalloprotease n=1 Tax=Bacillus glycinifermentans TaxID=1664069 RepID=A0AAJ3YY50_9BACI|nr:MULTISPECIES: CPBP family intramembrane glutamic endopeptidase [Bacillus]KKB72532.1 peptidase [Bacillus sp. TH008]MDU0073169.1 CPBP family intramembrane glutamic endopeptidase [Bacillus sp. IG6]MED8021006.1 CPBP family intramembrane metalloprotease [Bacillus glycinifermentans]QAT64055.1 CPBP family intramembrane metalloprotease [Bacillus glycinifermentans]WKB78004.1 CPBP family intramembrane metalloprotease [Bacillus glycinifermentans]
MRKQYWFIILTYVLMQLSSIVGVPLLYLLGVGKGQTPVQAKLTLTSVWSVIAFLLCLVIVLLILRTVPKTTLRNRPKASIGASVAWAVGGVFLAIFAQSIAAMIEMTLFGANPESENTQMIMKLIQALPLMVIVSSVFGPILEEIIFRKIIFGAIYEKTNFFIAALFSSVLFSVVHIDFSHFLIYAAMGFTFAFLYVRTNRIIVPIFAHVAMNTFVVIMQTFQGQIQDYLERVEKVQLIIGGFL